MTHTPTERTVGAGPTTGRADRAPLPGPLGAAVSAAYSAAMRRRNRRFDTGHGVVTFDRPVISVGNLTLGGTGKTPMVERVVALLREHGHDPAIAMRGYGSGRGRVSDEAEMYRRRFDDLPVVAQPRRVEGLIGLFATERGRRVDCVVLDDGFQHRRIARQLDLVLIDATSDPFADRVFPAGRLREPADGLGRATHAALTHAEMAEPAEVARLAERIAGRVSGGCAVCAHEWSGLRVVEGGRERAEPVAFLRGRRVVACCAIGKPEGFFAAVRGAGCEVVRRFALADHDPFRPRTVARLCRAASQAGAGAIVLTAKDWAKLAGRPVAWPAPVVAPELSLAFRSGWEELGASVLAVAGSRVE
jgi:tetraacyldisaccharide 4'-kinase